MDFKEYHGCVEKWFLKREPKEFPNNIDYVDIYNQLVRGLENVHKQVNAGADFTDDTTLTGHGLEHVKKVIFHISTLLQYEKAILTPFEVFHLLVAAHIHDIKNIEGRENHETGPHEIFADLNIQGLLDSRILRNIGFIASCHSGSFIRGSKKEKDKIGFLLNQVLDKNEHKIHPQFLAAVLRLADEYADDSERAMEYLLRIKKIKIKSIIHQKYAESLKHTYIMPNSGIVELDFFIKKEDAIIKFPKYQKEIDSYDERYLLDEIFERTVKSHYETIYCMRFLRPSINITTINVTINIEQKKITDNVPKFQYELREKGYPNDTLNIIDLCGDSLKNNGGYWSGENLKECLTKL